MKTQEIIDQARQGFDGELHTAEYRRIHADDQHLHALMNMLEIHPGKRYLDLGTGNGYLAFEMAKRFPNIQITGLDIARAAILLNQKLQRAQKLDHLEFMAYDGIWFPIDNESYKGIISRYAFHHFPDPVKSIQEMYRALEYQGIIIISDPKTYDEDENDFVDHFQTLKQDGHVHFYQEEELDSMFLESGFIKESQFQSKCTYPREMNERYQQLIEKTPKTILDQYQIKVDENVVLITVAVMNAMYRKK